MADNTPCPCGAAPTASRANPLTGVQPQCLSCAAEATSALHRRVGIRQSAMDGEAG